MTRRCVRHENPKITNFIEPTNPTDGEHCLFCGKEIANVGIRGYCHNCYNLLRKHGKLHPLDKKHKVTKRSIKYNEFHKVQPLVLERDNYRCVKCGSTDRLTVHHIIERCNGGENISSNLITLCYKCHCKAHKGEPVYNLMIKSLEG